MLAREHCCCCCWTIYVRRLLLEKTILTKVAARAFWKVQTRSCHLTLLAVLRNGEWNEIYKKTEPRDERETAACCFSLQCCYTTTGSPANHRVECSIYKHAIDRSLVGSGGRGSHTSVGRCVQVWILLVFLFCLLEEHILPNCSTNLQWWVAR
jgi:hypothetical protein